MGSSEFSGGTLARIRAELAVISPGGNAVPASQELERCALPKDPRNDNVGVEDGLDGHFARRLTLAIADFKSAFVIPAFLSSTRT